MALDRPEVNGLAAKTYRPSWRSAAMNRRNAIKLAVLALLAGGVVALYFSPLRAYLTKAHMSDLIAWLRGLWYGPIVLIALYAVGCVFALPASIFVIAAGVIWGWKLGAALRHHRRHARRDRLLLRRRFPRRRPARKIRQRRPRRAPPGRDRPASRRMLIVRLIPGPPFAVWNYAAGIARMRFRDYFWATLIGVIPSHIVFTYCADSLVNGTMTQGDALQPPGHRLRPAARADRHSARDQEADGRRAAE